MKSGFCSVLAIAAGWLAVAGWAGAAPPAFETKPPESGQFVVEYLYNYTRRDYVPPARMQPVARAAASYATPEDAFVAQMSAMQSGDYDWWLAGWTADSRAQIVARNAQLKRTGRDWAEIWKKGFAGQEVRLLQRADTGPYVFVVYGLFDDKGDKTFEGIFVSERVAEQWLATQALAEDPMFHHYLDGTNRVRLNVR